MLLGIEDAATVKGRFQEYEYSITVKRTVKSENFKCFKDNNLLEFTFKKSMFCNSVSNYFHIVDSWKSDDVWSYSSIKQSLINKSYSAVEVVELIYNRNQFKYIPQFMSVGSCDYIS